MTVCSVCLPASSLPSVFPVFFSDLLFALTDGLLLSQSRQSGGPPCARRSQQPAGAAADKPTLSLGENEEQGSLGQLLEEEEKRPESSGPRRGEGGRRVAETAGNGKTFFNYVKKSESASAGLQVSRNR